MKMFTLIISAVLLASCATPAAIRVEPEVQPEIRPEIQPEIIPQIIPDIRPADSFEYALLSVKNNTPLFQKSIINSERVFPVSGFRNIDDIRVIGEAVIDEKEFRVTYDLAGALPADNNALQIPFLLENLTDGVSRNDELIWHPEDDKVGLLLSFDDNYFDTWMRYLNIFTNHGAKVTFFVQGDLNAGNDDAMILEIFCRKALSRGHDLGYHTINHPNLTQISNDVFNSETIEAAQAFFDAGIKF